MLEGRTVDVSIAELSDEDSAALDADSATVRATLNRLLFPGPTKIYEQIREQYGDLSVVDTADYLYGLDPELEHTVRIGKGVQLFVGLEAIGEADAKGMRTVMTTLNGQLRPLPVRDKSIAVDITSAEKADAKNPGHVAAPFSGVVTVKVAVGDTVDGGAERRDHRGHEDGGGHHGRGGWNGEADRHLRDPAGRSRRPDRGGRSGLTAQRHPLRNRGRGIGGIRPAWRYHLAPHLIPLSARLTAC